jgi:3-deoxy-manno-octulosonate cytidylyltransferase (CMP-KDO synthetase)
MEGRERVKAIGVIPARWGSTRFPGKILAPICGVPLICWVIQQARKAKSLSEVLVATDDERIRRTAVELGVEAVMTPSALPSGTDRVAAAIEGREADVVINVQGDEPLIDPGLIDRLVAALDEPGWDMSTAATPIDDPAMLGNPGVVKVVWNERGAALYFSRSLIPFVRDPGPPPSEPLHWRHLGIYGYRREFLQRVVATPPCALERAEKLEQLRALHIGARMAVICTREKGIGVDTPQDVTYVENVIRASGVPEWAHRWQALHGKA